MKHVQGPGRAQSDAPARKPDSGDVSGHTGTRPSASDTRMDRIARRAHDIYLARGGTHGKALEDWLQAEREIDSELEQAGSDEG